MKRTPAISAIAFCTVLLVAAGARAQAPAEQRHQPSPEEMQKIMDATFGAMVPMMARMTEVMIEKQLEIGQRPETAVQIAAFKKNLFDALQKSGFTRDQALQIVLTTQLPAATPATK